MAEGRLKYLTQGAHSKVKAARKYENPIEFDATHTLWLDANERPQIRSADSSVWERLKPVPFEFRIGPDEIDKGLPQRLQDEAPGILAWMVQGCLRWIEEGLGEIADVAEAREEWKAECDPLADFVADDCELRPKDAEAFAWASDLWECYERWIRNNGEKYPLGRRRFAERLRALGCRDERRNDTSGIQRRTWEGIVLR